MIEIRNLLFQPLIFQMAIEQRGLHLGSRQRKLIEDTEVSEEIRIAAKRGIIELTVLDQPAQSEDIDTTQEAVIEPNAESISGELDDESLSADPEPTSEPRSRKRR